ncbi:hypothetical protein BKA65DRAFT_510931 [Rhexocercosporidium sp. MPI-PUGE-AT-0058]|nr:hypothetical protein BKA65DRAFT_510931 [Rhexocercosporidium sp. MPI-PUGE-AT-0058]
MANNINSPTLATGENDKLRITLIGAGTIGLSLAAVHLTHLSSPSHLTIHDPRPNLSSYIATNLPPLLPATHIHLIPLLHTINLSESPSTLPLAVSSATIIQESGPENLEFKAALWENIERHGKKDALFWSSTSGIPASAQYVRMQDKSRLVVVHPFNPPHILPLLEIIPSPHTSADVISRTMDFWRARNKEPVLLRKEITGFVAGRLAWALLREAIYLVNEGVVDVEELDKIIESSMGPRWAYAGPFKSFYMGGGQGGLEALFENVGGTLKACWEDEAPSGIRVGGSWMDVVCGQTRKAYAGKVDIRERDRTNRKILEVVREEKQGRGMKDVVDV